VPLVKPMRLTPFVRKWNPYRALLPLHPPGRVDARQNNEQQLLWRQLLQQQVHSAYTFLGVVGSTYHSESACTFLGVVRSTNHSESACTFLGVVGSTHHSESACTFLGVVGSTNHSESACTFLSVVGSTNHSESACMHLSECSREHMP